MDTYVTSSGITLTTYSGAYTTEKIGLKFPFQFQFKNNGFTFLPCGALKSQLYPQRFPVPLGEFTKAIEWVLMINTFHTSTPPLCIIISC